ncbi:hypothetical protein AB4039_04305 [Streptomyces sp. M-16]|uniref:hypothetical protein n=1 Tax=Streptomyces sp. M-16 TaxID=3233040 RepID=UPI0022506AB1
MPAAALKDEVNQYIAELTAETGEHVGETRRHDGSAASGRLLDGYLHLSMDGWGVACMSADHAAGGRRAASNAR